MRCSLFSLRRSQNGMEGMTLNGQTFPLHPFYSGWNFALDLPALSALCGPGRVGWPPSSSGLGFGSKLQFMVQSFRVFYYSF